MEGGEIRIGRRKRGDERRRWRRRKRSGGQPCSRLARRSVRPTRRRGYGRSGRRGETLGSRYGISASLRVVSY